MGNARNLMVSTDAIDADDLPDIVEIVMEMGRTPQEQPPEAPVPFMVSDKPFVL